MFKTIPSLMLEVISPSCEFFCKCQACGCAYRVTYRGGCFGPINIEVRRQPGLLNCAFHGMKPILCAHCGHEVWASPEQVLLRRALRLKRRLEKAIDGQVLHLLRREKDRRMAGWVDQLQLDHFRQLAPEWFATLWEGGPIPNQKVALPTIHSKKVRFFFRQVARADAMQAWPLIAPFEKTQVLNACHAVVVPYLKLAQRLAPGLECLGNVKALHGGAFWGPITERLDSRPGPGNTAFCYSLETVDGPELAKELLDLAALNHLPDVERSGAPTCSGDPILFDRLDILLHQHGLARK